MRSGALVLSALLMLAAPVAMAGSVGSRFAQGDDEAGLSDVELLGKRLFEDDSLSEPKGVACTSCHAPNRAFQGDNGSRVPGIAIGSRPDHMGTRKVPTAMYKSFAPPFGVYPAQDDEGRPIVQPEGGQFWDGRADGLADQAGGPLLNPDEMNNASPEAVVAKVQGGPYADLVKAALGDEVFSDPKEAFGKLSGAIAAYESTDRFHPFSSRFDDWLRGAAELTAQEKLGYDIFVDPKRGNCISCHAGNPASKDPHDWLFTDFSYSTLGAPRNNAVPANADPEHYDLGLCKRPGLAALLPKSITVASLCGQFKTPTLRNVAVSGPYFHNGSIQFLRGAVLFYAMRDLDPGAWYPKLATGEPDKFDDLPSGYKGNVDTQEVPYDRLPGERPRLDAGEVDALVAFLKTLTDKGMW